MDIVTHSYTVTTPLYEGPLDLLLYLIERAELDITKLSLAQVTDQFISHIHELHSVEADDVSSFLVIASKLCQIKSEALLPSPPLREPGEEDPGEALSRQLLAYKKVKDVANLLSSREKSGLRTYLRLYNTPIVENTFSLNGVSITDFLEAARIALQKFDDQKSIDSVVIPIKITIRQKIILIIEQLKQSGRLSFNKLLEISSSKIEIVVTFLALLELIKQSYIDVQQEEIFGEIIIQPVGQWNANEEFDLEFGE